MTRRATLPAAGADLAGGDVGTERHRRSLWLGAEVELHQRLDPLGEIRILLAQAREGCG